MSKQKPECLGEKREINISIYHPKALANLYEKSFSQSGGTKPDDKPERGEDKRRVDILVSLFKKTRERTMRRV